ncbi:SDR family NAD(P)-dependent oxidoreductase [Pedobacter xixiisoli]|uniref:Glucose 1-dehydrogenase n=1 Tax=Pedobacter xixiisoli TaxID=1476464 RepID=A0A286AES2_9SPHI|nr:SDR family NAD(P)-dependent oxidoreductase [Pedobacter xixiisoli]SOD20396.1 glucose 1-dehydrogenase [Pedobacter xixiisoli]
MTFDFKGKVALITGGESGIGASIATELAHLGCNIIIAYFKKYELAEKVLDQLNKNGLQNLMVNCDVRDETSVINLFRQARNIFGKIDFLINSAGIRSYDKPLIELSFAKFKNTVETNLFGVFLCSKYFINQEEHMMDGRIINITSIHQDVVSAGKTDYCASKFGVKGFSKALSLELAEKGITVNCIAPGMILTPMNEKAMNNSDYRIEQEKRIPLQYAGLPKDVANMAVFLCSPQAKYITGSTQIIDGGLSLNRSKGAK